MVQIPQEPPGSYADPIGRRDRYLFVEVELDEE
jgi:hypothetical protein